MGSGWGQKRYIVSGAGREMDGRGDFLGLFPERARLQGTWTDLLRACSEEKRHNKEVV